MNYRQWKKDYKKKHGYNPPLIDDKRKQSKAMRMMLRKLSNADVEELINRIIDGLSRAFKFLGETFTNAGNNLEVK